MQVVRRTETGPLSSRLLFRPLYRSEKYHTCARFLGSAPGNQKFEICAGAAQGRQLVCKSTGTIRNLSCPHVYLFNRVRHWSHLLGKNDPLSFHDGLMTQQKTDHSYAKSAKAIGSLSSSS